jgi:monomeric sarcosine oxidase
MARSYDAIVIGLGGIGSAALFQLAARRLRVLGIDRFHIGHDRGSSHGQTRVIRQAYFEHPSYVPLCIASYRGWRELEQRVGEQLLFQVGLLEIGPADGVVVPGVLRAAEFHGLAVDELGRREARRRFPQFALPQGARTVFEAAAGYLLVERCVIAHAHAAADLGAECHTDETVRSWRAEDGSVEVTTERSTYHAQRLVIAAGPWSTRLLADLGLSITVRKKHLYWFADDSDAYRLEPRCPVFLYEEVEGVFYGFPAIDSRGVKVGEHTGGAIVVGDPAMEHRELDPQDQARVESFVARSLPRLSQRLMDHTVCFYSMSPDEHFWIDRHPEYPQVAIAAGLSGHGFKFAPVLGEVLADLVTEGASCHPVEFLRLDRPWA